MTSRIRFPSFTSFNPNTIAPVTPAGAPDYAKLLTPVETVVPHRAGAARPEDEAKIQTEVDDARKELDRARVLTKLEAAEKIFDKQIQALLPRGLSAQEVEDIWFRGTPLNPDTRSDAQKAADVVVADWNLDGSELYAASHQLGKWRNFTYHNTRRLAQVGVTVGLITLGGSGAPDFVHIAEVVTGAVIGIGSIISTIVRLCDCDLNFREYGQLDSALEIFSLRDLSPGLNDPKTVRHAVQNRRLKIEKLTKEKEIYPNKIAVDEGMRAAIYEMYPDRPKAAPASDQDRRLELR